MDQIVSTVRSLSDALGTVDYLLGDAEEVQFLLAQSRERLGLTGVGPMTALNFRDKIQMKQLLERAGLPCAKHSVTSNLVEIERFASLVGYPIIIKPSTGARSENVSRVDRPSQIPKALKKTLSTEYAEVLCEEYIHGQEYSCDSFTLDGHTLWQSVTRYIPSPLEANYDPHVQWCVLLENCRSSRYKDAKMLASKALNVLGMTTGFTHMEWFRKADGSVIISEIAGRPPGAKITSLISKAHDIDFMRVWLRLLIWNEFTPIPKRRFSAGAIFLRGAGSGRVVSVRGIQRIMREWGHLIVQKQIPWPGQKATSSYEGNGYIVLRHPKTEVVENALMDIARSIDVKLTHPFKQLRSSS
jgi:biotin carboxylase